MTKRGAFARAALYARTALQTLKVAPFLIAGCIAVVAVAAFVTCSWQKSYLVANGFTPGYLDSLIWLFSSHKGIPLLWCIVPGALMVWLVAVKAHRQGAAWAIRHKSVRELWIEDVVDAIIGAAVFAAVTVVSACMAASMFSGGTQADFGPHGIFAAVTGQVPLAPLSEASVTLACVILSFLVLAVFGIAFQLGRLLLNNPAIPFVALVLLGIPTIHGPQALLVEVAHLFNLSVDPNGIPTNPLSLPFEITSAFYHSWLPGAGHGFWLQVVLFVALLGIGLLVAPRKDHLNS